MDETVAALVSGFINLRETETDRQQPICSHTVQALAKPKPLRSHSMASNPRIVRRAVWKD